jgi:hypothetical protein
MTPTHHKHAKALAGALMIVLAVQPLALAQDSAAPPGATSPSQPAPDANPGTPAPLPATPLPPADPIPDSPGSVQGPTSRPTSDSQSPSTTNSGSEANEPQSGQASEQPSQSQSDQQTDTASGQQRAPDTQPAPVQSPPREPRGTAAAESIPTTGVAASRPAGAAVAPAKQRRVRSILIKVGALVGVGAAVGATMALSQGSPSRPPGSR